MSFTAVNASITAGPRDSDNLFYKVFTGEVMATFNASTVMRERHRIRNISHGKSAAFAAIGKVSAGYHQPGNVILGQKVNNGEITITIDDMLLADVFISNYEEAKLHYDVRSEYSTQMGQALAQAYDKQLFAVGLKAARAGTSGPVSEMGAAESLSIGATPTAADIVEGFFEAQVKFDQKNVPEADRFAFVSPSVFYTLAQETSLVNRDFSMSNGDYAKGVLKTVAGIDIVKTNNLALNHTNATIQGMQGGTVTNDYNVNGSDCVALIMNRQALGSVHLMDIATETEYMVHRQGTLMVNRMAVGHGVLRPECLIELRAA